MMHSTSTMFLCLFLLAICLQVVSMRLPGMQVLHMFSLLFLVMEVVGSENSGLLALTRVGSRRVAQIAAGFMILFSILGYHKESVGGHTGGNGGATGDCRWCLYRCEGEAQAGGGAKEA